MSEEKKKMKDWGEKEIRAYLEKEGLETWKTLFEEKGVTDVDLQTLDRLEEICKMKRGDRLTIINAVVYILLKKSKVLNDPIHGLIELHPLLIKIMDTPQFQRLRYIKQLGGAYFVYPGASHNRFEHSVGVAHLAGELARALESKQPELGITERDILCVEIAGLCHDLGFGPFSHLYDRMFLPKACSGTQWKHEDVSLLMFDHLVEDNGLKPLMELYGLKPEETEENDLVFIKEMIQGNPPSQTVAQEEGQAGAGAGAGTEEGAETEAGAGAGAGAGNPLSPTGAQEQWPYEGRTEEKSFLYEIVTNSLNGIDVDKFDYLARDAYYLGMQSNFDHKRFIKLARVCEVKEKPKKSEKPEETEETEETEMPKKWKKRICSRYKEVGNLYDMFHMRNCLYRRAYQHKTNKGIEMMIRDAFLKADEHIKIEGKGGEKRKLSTAIDDMEAYTKLTDQVFETILHPSPLLATELKEASKILERIVSRNLYTFVGETKPTKEEIPKKAQEKIDDLKATLALAVFQDANQADKFEVSIVTLDYGMKKKDPIKNTYFYKKYDLKKGITFPPDEKSKLLPKEFSEKIIRVYCKDARNITLKVARKAFQGWCTEYKCPDLEEEDGVEDL